MRDDLERCLEDLERRLDAAVEDTLLDEWNRFADGEFRGEVFSPRRAAPAPPRVEWPRVPVNSALGDFDLMALQQYGGCSASLADGDGRLLNVRSNYGTSILPSIFGVRLFVMDDSAGTLPTSWPLEGGVDAIRRIVAGGVPARVESLAGKALEMGARFMDIQRRYPKIGRYVHVYHPDTQSPMDACEVLWGSDLFVDVVEDPGLVQAFNSLLTDAYVSFMRAWYAAVPPEWPDRAVHYGCLHRGRVMLREDSATNFSPAMYREFIRDHHQRVFDELGGGAIHFCGRGDHFIGAMAEMRGLSAVNMSQPALNDMEVILRNTVDRGVNLIGNGRGFAGGAVTPGRPLRGRVHCYDTDRSITG